MKFDDDFYRLVEEVRAHREKMPYCPSAQKDVDVSAIVMDFCDNAFYREDYQAITSYFAADYVSYEEVIENIKRVVKIRISSDVETIVLLQK